MHSITSRLSPEYMIRSRLPTRTLFTLSAASIALALLWPRHIRKMSDARGETSATLGPWSVRAYQQRFERFPYTATDLRPMDTSSDADFYSSPRFVTHIDDHAISILRRYYGSILPTPLPPPSERPRVLDLCSSWVSHYPLELEEKARTGQDLGLDIAGLGMNVAEMQANPLFGGKQAHSRWMVKDLNHDPTLPSLQDLYKTGNALLDVSTLTVSIDYITAPHVLLRALLEATKPGGSVHLAISNRCFPTKAMGRWLRINEEERLQMVGDFLHEAGWEQIQIIELSNGFIQPDEDAYQAPDQRTGNVSTFMTLMGMNRGNRCDPLWVVRAVKPGNTEGQSRIHTADRMHSL